MKTNFQPQFQRDLVVDTNKGFRYNMGKPKWSLVDFPALEPLAEVMEYGAHKYSIFEDENGNKYKGSEVSAEQVKKLKLKCIYSGRENWKGGLDQTEILESLTRHLFALFAKETIDPESGKQHIGHILANAMFWSYFQKQNNETEATKTRPEYIGSTV